MAQRMQRRLVTYFSGGCGRDETYLWMDQCSRQPLTAVVLAAQAENMQ